MKFGDKLVTTLVCQKQIKLQLILDWNSVTIFGCIFCWRLIYDRKIHCNFLCYFFGAKNCDRLVVIYRIYTSRCAFVIRSKIKIRGQKFNHKPRFETHVQRLNDLVTIQSQLAIMPPNYHPKCGSNSAIFFSVKLLIQTFIIPPKQSCKEQCFSFFFFEILHI